MTSAGALCCVRIIIAKMRVSCVTTFGFSGGVMQAAGRHVWYKHYIDMDTVRQKMHRERAKRRVGGALPSLPFLTGRRRTLRAREIER